MIHVINPLSHFNGQTLSVRARYSDGAVAAEFIQDGKRLTGTFTKREFIETSGETVQNNTNPLTPPPLQAAELAKRNGVCACGCGRILRTHEPFVTYKVRGDNREFATPECRDAAFSGLKRNPKRTDPQEGPVKIQADDFGEAPVARLVCDNPSCGTPIIINYQGRDGNYCSPDCRRAVEGFKKENQSNMSDTTNAPIQAAEPISAPKKVAKKAPAKAKATKKNTAAATKATKKNTAAATKATKKNTAAATKATNTKATAPSLNGTGRTGMYDPMAVIQRTATWKDWKMVQGASQGAMRLRLLRDGMTILKFKEACKAAGLPAWVDELRTGHRSGFVTIE